MVLRGEIPQRRVQLRREDEHRERRLERNRAVDETDADGDRDERDAERRRQLEHGTRQERDPQRRHRRAAVLLADLLEPLRLRLAAVERAERRQAADDVEEVRGEDRERLPPLVRALRRVPADEPHEDRHERQRQQQQPGGDRVEHRHEREHRHRHDDGEDDLRQIPRERRLQRADPRDRERRDLAALRPVERRRLRAQPLRDEIEPELREDRRRAAPTGDLEAPREQRARREHRDEQDDARLDLRERRAVERTRDDPREQQRLAEDEQRRADAERPRRLRAAPVPAARASAVAGRALRPPPARRRRLELGTRDTSSPGRAGRAGRRSARPRSSPRACSAATRSR